MIFIIFCSIFAIHGVTRGVERDIGREDGRKAGRGVERDVEPAKLKKTMAGSLRASDSRHILLIAHRGAPINEPENSLAGYRAAVGRGAMFIEFDLVISKDGIIYICHDNNLWRTTGRNVLVSRSNSQELDKIKLRNGEKLPRLSAFFGEFGSSILYLAETKDVGAKQSRLMDKTLAALIRQRHLESKVMIQSQSLTSLKALHSEFGHMPCMYLIGRTSKNGLIKTVNHLPRWVDAVGVSQRAVTKKSVRLAHRRGLRVALYTIKTRKDMKRALRYDPDMICTDDVGMSLRYLLRKHWTPGDDPLMREVIR
ncbi:MAG: glycerophosphodiester phosphodiesterase [Clostridiales Family XIII bacterium]|nr:glycerophosphodiester phosphodiesterase [Clostridiales Family XIII bacterium]